MTVSNTNIINLNQQKIMGKDNMIMIVTVVKMENQWKHPDYKINHHFTKRVLTYLVLMYQMKQSKYFYTVTKRMNFITITNQDQLIQSK